MRERLETAKVVELFIGEPVQPVVVEPRYRDVHLIVRDGATVVGEVLVPGLAVLTPRMQIEAVTRELGEALWRRRLHKLVEGSLPRLAPQPMRVSLVICTRDRPEDLLRCLKAVGRLEPSPAEVLVVDNCPTDDGARRVCAEAGVRYVVEPAPGLSRARNRGILETSGDLIAFTDDDCVPDAAWLREIEAPFSDPLVVAVTGYVAPLELETPAQYRFERHGGFERHNVRKLFDGVTSGAVAAAGQCGPGASVVFRRSIFREIGLFAEDLGSGTPARSSEDAYQLYRVLSAGYRVVFDPSRLVRHRHRRDDRSLRAALVDAAAGSSAYATRCLVRHRELAALRIFAWWIRHVLGDLAKSLRDDDDRLPLRLVLAEALALARGPWRLLRSRLSRRRIPPLVLPDADSDARPRLAVLGADAPALSVAVASYNRREQLREVLVALGEQSYPSERYEVVLVVDGSTDGTAEMARSLELPYRLRVVEQENRGLAATRNRGAHEAAHPVVVFLDDDIVPEPAFLAEHARAHQSSPDDHVALGAYPAVVTDPSLWGFCVRAWWSDHFRRKAHPQHQWTFADFCDGNASLPRQLLLAAGGYDEEFRGGCRQDWELAIRLLEQGVRFEYQPSALGRHYLDTTLATGLRRAREEGRSDVLIAEKHPHVKSRLALAELARSLGDELSRPAELAYRHPRAAATAAVGLQVVLGGLERTGLRRRWTRLATMLTMQAYLAGVGDVLKSPEELLRFAGPLWERTETASLALGDRSPIDLRLSPASGEVELTHRGDRVARVLGILPGHQWSEEELLERIAETASEPLRHTILRAALADPGHDPDLPRALLEEAGRAR